MIGIELAGYVLAKIPPYEIGPCERFSPCDAYCKKHMTGAIYCGFCHLNKDGKNMCYCDPNNECKLPPHPSTNM